MELTFEWDEHKAQKNLKNHRVSFEEAKTIFNDPFLWTFPDPDHSDGEQRYLSIGRSARGRVLILCHTERERRKVMDDQRRTALSSGGDWPCERSDEAPTQRSGGASLADHPTPRSVPVGGVGAWSPVSGAPVAGAPVAGTPVAGASASSRPATSPFHSTSEQAARAAEGDADKTMLMRREPEPLIPLAWLAIVDGPGGKRGALFTLKAETIVGRTSGDFLLGGDHTVSSQHIRVRLEALEGEGGEQAGSVFVLYDQASSNGTYVGDKHNYRDEDKRVYRHELKDGDYVLVGETTLVFKQIA